MTGSDQRSLRTFAAFATGHNCPYPFVVVALPVKNDRPVHGTQLVQI